MILRSEIIHRPRPGSNPRTSDPEASMITTELPGSTLKVKDGSLKKIFKIFIKFHGFIVHSKTKNMTLSAFH